MFEVLTPRQEAWNDSFNTPTTAQEIGGWIYADQNSMSLKTISKQTVNNVFTIDPDRIFIRRAPRDRSHPMNQLRPPPGVAAGIDLWSPENASGRPPPAGFVLVATFHTHPVSIDVYHDL